MNRTCAVLLSLVLAIALGILTGLATKAAMEGWGLRPHGYDQPPEQSNGHKIEDFNG